MPLTRLLNLAAQSAEFILCSSHHVLEVPSLLLQRECVNCHCFVLEALVLPARLASKLKSGIAFDHSDEGHELLFCGLSSSEAINERVCITAESTFDGDQNRTIN